MRNITGKTFYLVTVWCESKAAEDCTKMDGSQKLKIYDEIHIEI